MTGESGAAGGPQTVTVAVAVFTTPPVATNVNVTVVGPGAVAEDATSEKRIASKEGGARISVAGEIVTPGGRPEGVTVTPALGGQEPVVRIEAEMSAPTPPPLRTTAVGSSFGSKEG